MMSSASMTYDSERQHRRVPFREAINVRIADWPDLNVRGHDVSRGGIALILGYPVSVGDRLLFGLLLPSGKVRKLEAVVCYALPVEDTGELRVGLRWVNLSAIERDALCTFIDGVTTH